MTGVAALAALADGVWVSGLVAAGACAVVVATGRSALTGYRVRLAALVLCVALPAAALWRLQSGAPGSDRLAPSGGTEAPDVNDASSSVPDVVNRPHPSGEGVRRRGGQDPGVQSPVAAAPRESPLAATARAASEILVVRRPALLLRDGLWAAAVLGILLAGVLIGLVRFALAVAGARALRRQSRVARHVPPEWPRALALAGLRRPVELRTLPHLRTPAAIGLLEPLILVPEGMLEQLTGDERLQVLLHEAVHLRRRDDWAGLFQHLALAVCWFHPVARWLGAGIDLHRELACDEAVAARAGPHGYARTLLRVAGLAGRVPVPLGAPALVTSRSRLSRRINALVRPRLKAGPWRRTLVASCAPIALTAAVCVAPLGTRPGQPAGNLSDTTGAPAAGRAPGPAAGAAPFTIVDPAGTVRGPLGVALDRALTRMADSGFSGTVLVEQAGVVVLEKGYGLADRAAGVAATAETRYSLAGFTKAVTASAVLRLVDEGRLALNDPVGRYLPELRRKGGVTIEQLLTHRDGMTVQGAPVYRADAASFLRAVDQAPSAFAAGTGYRYNDFGHSILALVIERVTGQPYEQHIRTGLAADGSGLGFESDGAALAVEYRGTEGFPIGRRQYQWGRRGSLGLVGTARDAHAILTALDSLPPSIRAALLASRGPTAHGTDQTYGWERLTKRGSGHEVLRRIAGTPGFEGELLRDETAGWSAVILVNSRLGWRFRVWSTIEALAGE